MERWEKVKAELPALEHVVMIGDADDFADYEWVSSWSSLLAAGREELATPEGREAFEAAWKATTPDDVATLIYTSGTTGPPKGVVLTHRNVIWTAASIDRTGAYPAGLRGVSYLPLAHALERLATHYLSLYKAANVHFCPEVLQVFEYVPTVRPQAFAGVPRLFEKLQAGILAGINEEPNERRRKIALGAVKAGQEAARLEREGTPVPFGLKVKRAAFDKLVFSKVRHKIGLDQCMFTVTGAAPMAPDTHDFFAGIGLPLYEGYGMTESSAPATLNLPGRRKAGSVGPRLPGVEIALAEDGEVLIRGDNVTSGYYREPEKTAETVDGDGWLHTGDIGKLDVEGFLFIVDRKKELIVTSGGKNISPANIEALLKSHPLIGQAAAIGDGRKYMSALIVLDAEAARAVGEGQRRAVHRPGVVRAGGTRQGRDPARGRRHQPAPVAGRGHQAVDDPADRVDGRLRGAHADAEAQAPRDQREVPRRDRTAVLLTWRTAGRSVRRVRKRELHPQNARNAS